MVKKISDSQNINRKRVPDLRHIHREAKNNHQSHSNLLKQIEQLVHLVKKGDPSSLTELRQKLGITQNELALKMNVSQHQLQKWEESPKKLSGKNQTQWKLKLSSYIDGVISDLLGTKNTEVNIKFWKIVWELVD